jgi:hypothetical protein
MEPQILDKESKSAVFKGVWWFSDRILSPIYDIIFY